MGILVIRSSPEYSWNICQCTEMINWLIQIWIYTPILLFPEKNVESMIKFEDSKILRAGKMKSRAQNARLNKLLHQA